MAVSCTSLVDRRGNEHTPAVQWYQCQLLTADADALPLLLLLLQLTLAPHHEHSTSLNDVSALVRSRDIAQVSFDAHYNDVLQTSLSFTFLHLRHLHIRQCFQRPVSIR